MRLIVLIAGGLLGWSLAHAETSTVTTDATAIYERSRGEGSVRRYAEAIADLQRVEMEPRRLFAWPFGQEPKLVAVPAHGVAACDDPYVQYTRRSWQWNHIPSTAVAALISDRFLTGQSVDLLTDPSEPLSRWMLKLHADVSFWPFQDMRKECDESCDAKADLERNALDFEPSRHCRNILALDPQIRHCVRKARVPQHMEGAKVRLNRDGRLFMAMVGGIEHGIASADYCEEQQGCSPITSDELVSTLASSVADVLRERDITMEQFLTELRM